MPLLPAARRSARHAVFGALAVCIAACGGSPTAPDGTTTDFGTHREVIVSYRSSDGARLEGTLFLPETPGRYPAVVMHYGSNRWTRSTYQEIRGWIGLRMAVLSYDKRGVGKSQGECCPASDPGYFPLLANDVIAGVRRIAKHPDVRADLIGVFGFSQGGWIVPVAAANAANEIAFTIIGSGPAVTLGEELLFSHLTGEDQCQPTNATPEAIEAAMNAAGPSRFNPRPYLEEMTRPGLWMYGSADLSVPVDRSVAALTQVRDTFGRDFTIHVEPGLNHSWIPNGGICQEDGAIWNDGPVLIPWLRAKLPPW